MKKIWKLADGVVAPSGCDPDGMLAEAYAVVCNHVMHGMCIYGMFLTRDAAAAWIKDHADDEIDDYSGHAKEWDLFIEPIVIPTHYTGEVG